MVLFELGGGTPCLPERIWQTGNVLLVTNACNVQCAPALSGHRMHTALLQRSATRGREGVCGAELVPGGGTGRAERWACTQAGQREGRVCGPRGRWEGTWGLAQKAGALPLTPAVRRARGEEKGQPAGSVGTPVQRGHAAHLPRPVRGPSESRLHDKANVSISVSPVPTCS